MAEGRRGLGRGLSALLDEVEAASTPEGRRAAGVLDVPIELIRPNPEQPRRAFGADELEELAASIRERGVLQPILVRPMPGAPGDYQIIAGERRWRAAQQAGLRAIPALVRDLADQEVMEVALIENIQRSDLNALEEARAYESMVNRFQRSPEAIAKVVGKSRSHVANTLRLIRLPPAVRDHLESGRLTAGHARAVLDLEDAPALANLIVEQGLNVRQAEALARDARDASRGNGGKEDSARAPMRPRSGGDADTRALEADLEAVLGLAVRIRDRAGVGEVRIAYASLEQLDDLCRRLSRPQGAS
jgi:ParB family chromosome partitioning protein